MIDIIFNQEGNETTPPPVTPPPLEIWPPIQVVYSFISKEHALDSAVYDKTAGAQVYIPTLSYNHIYKKTSPDHFKEITLDVLTDTSFEKQFALLEKRNPNSFIRPPKGETKNRQLFEFNPEGSLLPEEAFFWVKNNVLELYGITLDKEIENKILKQDFKYYTLENTKKLFAEL